MAFSYCTKCGARIEENMEKCPVCGAPVTIFKKAENENLEKLLRETENKSREETPENKENNVNNGENPLNDRPKISYEVHDAKQVGPFTFQVKYPRDLDLRLVILSIFVILFGGCCLGIPMGILALMFTQRARFARTKEEEKSIKKTALILDIIGGVSALVGIANFVLQYIDLFKNFHGFR